MGIVALALALAFSGDPCGRLVDAWVALLIVGAVSIGVTAFLLLEAHIRRLWVSLVAAVGVAGVIAIVGFVVGMMRWALNCAS